MAIWYQRKPQLKYEILSQWPVYSIREEIPDLEIMFKGENIRKEQQALSVITIRISNPGSAAITLNSFDQRDLPGFSVSDGKIIKLDPIERSKKLEKTLELTRTADNAYVIQPLILDTNQFFVLKLLVLSAESSHPKVQCSGDIAGVDKIEVVSAPSTEKQRSFLSDAFYAHWIIQVVRSLVYTAATLFLIIFISTTINAMFTKLRRAHRRRLVRKFRSLLDHDPTKKENAVFDRYIQSGESAVVQLNQSFADRALLKQTVLEYLTSIDPAKSKQSAAPPLTTDMLPEHFLVPSPGRFIPMLLEQKIITVQDNNVTVDEQTVKTVSSFESFLLANEPERIKTAKTPLGSDVNPMADVTSLPATKKPENE
ncbi:MAG: hypothetical protein WA183_04760 [Chthoniobacterales bacterium]